MPEWQRFPSILNLIESSRIVVLCASYHTNEKAIVGKNEIAAMAGRYFVNTARGELVDEEALLAAARSNRLRGIAIDVIANENGDNRLDEWRALLPGRNLILTPHIAGATFDSMSRTECFIADKLITATKEGASL
jgi:D-3-phosphoglycerate dehydrogenase